MAITTAVPAPAEVGAPERFRAAAGSLPGRLRRWTEIAADTLVAFEVRARDDFRGEVRRRRFGDLALVDCAVTPHVGHRGQEEAVGRDGEDAVLGFQFVRRGAELVRRPGGTVALTAGDVLLWDGLHPTAVEIEVPEPLCKRTVVFPRELVYSVCPRLAEQPTPPRIDSRGPARLLVSYVNALSQELPGMDACGAAAAASAAVELLRAVVEPCLPASRATTRAALRAEIRRYVRLHLQDPGLGPASIAKAHSISVRALHALFEDAEESVASLVRAERLARCLEDLRQPGAGSVTSIAFRWGFCDTAHFSRVFKRAFGVTPSTVRQAALAGYQGP